MNQSIPEHESKVPLWRKTSFWAGVGAVAITALMQVAQLLPHDSPALPYVGAAVAIGLSLQEGQVRASRNLASGAVEAAKAQSNGAALRGVGAQILGNEIERATGSDAAGGLASALLEAQENKTFGVDEPFPRGVADTLDPTYFADGAAPGAAP